MKKNIRKTILLEISDWMDMGHQRKNVIMIIRNILARFFLIVELFTNKKIKFGVKNGLDQDFLHNCGQGTKYKCAATFRKWRIRTSEKIVLDVLYLLTVFYFHRVVPHSVQSCKGTLKLIYSKSHFIGPQSLWMVVKNHISQAYLSFLQFPEHQRL